MGSAPEGGPVPGWVCPRPCTSFLLLQEDEPQGWMQSPASSDAVRSQSSEAPPNLLVYSTVLKGSPGAAPPLPAEPSAKGSSSREVKAGQGGWRHFPKDRSHSLATGLARRGDAAGVGAFQFQPSPPTCPTSSTGSQHPPTTPSQGQLLGHSSGAAQPRWWWSNSLCSGARRSCPV